MSGLPMPAPWRAFAAEIASVETDSALYARLKDAYFARGARELPPEAVDQWDADQDAGALVITCPDDSEVRARFEILGTHDGADFLWADANTSIQQNGAAARFRASLKASGAEALGAPNRLPLGLRDMSALLAMAGDVLDAQNTFLARSRGVTAAMILSDVTMKAAAPEPEKPGFPGGLLGKRKAETPAEYASPLQMMNQMIQAQVDAHALAPEKLAGFDAICADTHADYLASRHDVALGRIAKGKSELGQFFIDQEPAGWLLYCEGACLLTTGDHKGAHQAFRDAGRALVPPPINLVRLGLARAAPTEALKLSYLSGLYLGSPAWFAEHATAEETALVRAAQGEADAVRASVADDAEAVLRAAIAARYAQEKRAYALSQAADRQRKEKHILSDADIGAHDAINAEFRTLLLTWFDAPRDPSMGSWSSDPSESPDRLETLAVKEQSSEAAVLEAAFKTSYGSIDNYRYKLMRARTPLSEQELWRVSEVWSVWPDEDIRLL